MADETAPASPAEEELTESGRPKVPRPMPDTSDATHCPHCNVEVGQGHYVCWNCSKDVRMKERTEDEILTEYEWMLVKAEMELEEKNQRFFLIAAALSIVFGVAGVFIGFRIGSIVVFGLIALIFVVFWRRSKARQGRIKRAHDL